MTKDVLSRAKDLERDIRSLEVLLNDYESGNSLHISCSNLFNPTQSVRLQKELCEWIRQKKSKYEKELEAL